jgi:hypothetical protein
MKILRFKKKITPKQLKTTEVATLRNELLEKQKGRCPICGGVIIDPVLDHSHKKRIGGSGLCRGVLDRNCNSYLGKAENNSKRFGIDPKNLPKYLRAMADYLDTPDLPYIHPSEKPKRLRLQKSSYLKLKKAYKGKAVLPPYNDKTCLLTVKLAALFEEYSIEPTFYAK